MSTSNRPFNRLLLALPSRDLKRLMPELEHIRCQREQLLIEADSSLDHVFFPESGVISAVSCSRPTTHTRSQTVLSSGASRSACMTDKALETAAK